jgi:methionyl-tRNA formyltransferase
MNDGIPNAVFLGSKALGLSVLQTILTSSRGLNWTIIHPYDENDSRSVFDEFKKFSVDHNVKLVVAKSSADAKHLIAECNAQIGFVCGWYWILDDAVLELVPRGLWGIHNSLLPKYRGGSPLVWSIINGDKEVGSTVFKISAGVDTGDILYQVKTHNHLEDNIQTILIRLESLLLNDLPDKWQALLNGKIELKKQRDVDATYCGQRIPDDGLIDWSKSATEIHNFIRAQSPPYPCAFSFSENERIYFEKTKIHAGIFDGTPGQILRRDRDYIVVACGERTALEVLEISVAGTKICPSRHFRSIKQRLKKYEY